MPEPLRTLVRHVLVACAIAAAATLARGQDVHFTQFYASPMLLNPALAGAFDGQLRASMIYRDQNRGVLPSPFTTISAALDFRFPVAIGGRDQGDAAAAGIVFFNDRVSEYDYSHNQIMLNGAYHKMLDKRTNQILSGGVALGIGQRNVNFTDLDFQDEFSIRPNGTSGYFGATREEFPPNNITFFDVNAGVNYSYAPRGRAGFYVGAAAHHVNEPDVSFFSRETDAVESETATPLRRKYSLHAASVLPLSSTLSLQPRALAQLQGQHAQAVLGANVRMQADEFSSFALHLGSWVRGVRDLDAAGVDAVVALVGIEYGNVLLGASYDVGVSDFTAGDRGRGALEISLAYLGSYENDALLCPQF